MEQKKIYLASLISAKKNGKRIRVANEQKEEFLRQVREYDFSSARDIVAVYEILDDSALEEPFCWDIECTFREKVVDSFLSKEELKELDNFFLSQKVTKMSLENVTERMLEFCCRHFVIECTGGEIYFISLSGEVIYRGYYKHNTAFSDNKQNAEMLSFWEKDGSEKLMLKLFAE